MRGMYAKGDNVADMIPVDVVINLMCAVARKTYVQYKEGRVENIPVYNSHSSTEKPVTWREATVYGVSGCLESPFENIML